MLAPAIPTKIAPLASDPRCLELRWNTGEKFSIDYIELRFHCPCASCVNEITGERVLERSELDKTVRPLDVSPVGRYGIRIQWSDGHATGMYHFDRLFQLCQRIGKAI